MRITDTWDRPGGGINRTGAAIIKSRTIPTRVGKTHWHIRTRSRHPDHPHAGGENYGQPRTNEDTVGPSPRGWGKLEGVADVGGVLELLAELARALVDRVITGGKSALT